MLDKHLEIDKPLGTILLEFVDALQLLRDSAKAIREGKLYYVAALAGQLRALLTDKTKAGPRLFHIGRLLGMKFEVFCYPDVNDPLFPEELRQKLIFHLANWPITLEKVSEQQELVNFQAFLDHERLLLRGKKFTVRTLIDWIANRNGGAHYANKTPKALAQMLAFHVGGPGMAAPYQLLLHVSDATIQLGLRLLREFVDQSTYFLVAVPPAGLKSGPIIADALHPSKTMRATVAVNSEGELVFAIQDLSGIEVKAGFAGPIDWSEPRWICLAVEITDNLHTEVRVAVDGKEYARTKLEAPIFILSNWRDFDVYFNRFADEELQDSSFALDLYFQAADASSNKQEQMVGYMDMRRSAALAGQMCLYSFGSYGCSPAGTGDMKMTGEVALKRTSDILATTE